MVLERANSLKDLIMTQWYNSDNYVVTQNGAYSMTRSYNELIGVQVRPHEANLIWNIVLQLKHRFYVWLVNQNRMLTKERLVKMHIQLKD